ncbi:hypothetical protein [Candidatus Poriferisodalis sp.]|uniref:hypothetical protein n=1 Tax=Candidatus Poriferisodalis sp. TaxID=3101277 RepID=UPI003D0FEAF4
MLAAAVDERLRLRWSPHAAAADLREAGMSVCAETIYRACYANDARSGLPAGYSAPAVAAAVTAALGRQPGGLVRTLTWDQGRETARWADIEAALGIEVLFCEPRSPWQRPTNAPLRRWLPKGTSLDIGQLRLSVIEDKLNHMPRRLHHWASAHDIYTQLTCNHR